MGCVFTKPCFPFSRCFLTDVQLSHLTAQDRSKQQQEFLKDRKISKFFKKEHTIREIFKKIGLKILN